jgi:hypothetical protein
MAVILRCDDRWGREVTLTEYWWSVHILREHPAMRRQLPAIAGTLAALDLVNEEALHPEREVFYRRGIVAKALRRYLKVVATYHAGGAAATESGRVVTAYLTDRIKPGERPIWP